MDVQEVLDWADRLVLEKTGQHLDSLQRAVLEGTWEGKKYPEIAQNSKRGHDRIKQVASELWKMMSAELGKDVRQSNFRAILEKVESSKISNLGLGDDYVQIVGDINICREHCPYPQGTTATAATTPTPTSNQPEQRHNLTEAPEPEPLQNRNAELRTLNQWILTEKIRIVTIFGWPGIGKTTLARSLVEQIKHNFEYIIWRHCTSALTLTSLETNLIQFFSQNRDTQQPSLIEYIRSHRCLIILDDLQELFTSGASAGTYLPECENYGKLWQQIARFPHESCILLLSWENPTEIATLEGENRPCRSLQLRGLGEAAGEILTQKGLTDEDRWGELIQLYGGNPSWLNIIASTIEDLFNGSVDGFLSYPSFFLGDLEPRVQSYYQRLSESEQIVTQWLANQDAADISRKPADLKLSDSDFLKAVRSLRKRGLIEKVTDNGVSLFAIPDLFKAYVKHQ
ncbi:NB-ARC domain-containing protein [[Phormidium] sp. ETS-05]|uniref:NB-ARC domain-containing protein n=1 Tax=[Phormidium] sp. ETS-05 TaxID=222819 RepID=UPI0018EEDA73|nr:NB-ARC domain-containing protein [[Phormidium] sp. ETS-05]